MRLWRSGVSCDSAVARPLGRWCGAKWRQRSDKVLDHMRTCASTQHLPGRSGSSVGSRGATTAPSPALQAPPRHAMCTTYTRKYTNIYVIRFGIRPPPPRPGGAAPRPPPRHRPRAARPRAAAGERAYSTYGACLARRGSRARTRDHTETDATRPRADGAWRLAPRGRGARQRPAGPAGIRDAPRRHGGAMGRDRGGGCRTPDLRSDVPRPTSHRRGGVRGLAAAPAAERQSAPQSCRINKAEPNVSGRAVRCLGLWPWLGDASDTRPPRIRVIRARQIQKRMLAASRVSAHWNSGWRAR